MGVLMTRGVATGKGLATMPFRAVARHPMASATLGGVLVAASLWAWWVLQLWGLPDIGDPFDVAAFESYRVPEGRNAFVEYRKAASMLDALMRRRRVKFDDYADEWAKASQPWRDLVTDARAALDTWRAAGTERPDAHNEYPEGLGYQTSLPVTDKLRIFQKLAILEGSRLEAQGDMAGTWGWYCATFRSSRHSGRHGFSMERRIGANMHQAAAKALTRWAADPRTDAPSLRWALDEVIAIDAMTPPTSDSIKMGYLAIVNELNHPASILEDSLTKDLAVPDPDWCRDLPVPFAARMTIQSARVGLRDDHIRSLRVARLLAANWLAQVDRPPSLRAPLAHQKPPIYEHDPDAPAEARALSPGSLAGWYDSSLFASRFDVVFAPTFPWLGPERTRQARLVVHLASELYRREHGEPPPSPRVLVGPYLKALPEGFDAVDEPVKAGH